MQHITAQRIQTIADKALRMVEEGTLKAAKAFIAHQCDESAMHINSASGLNFRAIESAFRPAILASRKNKFAELCADISKKAHNAIATIQATTRAELIMRKASERSLIVSEATALVALAKSNNDYDLALRYLFESKPATSPITGETTPATCRAQAQQFRRVGDDDLAEEWEKEAVRVEIMLAGGTRSIANTFITGFGLDGALAAFLTKQQGSIRYFQRSYELTKDEMQIAGADLGNASLPELTKPQRLAAFEGARERHQQARLELIRKSRGFAQCHDPGVANLFNAAERGDYLPAELEQRLIKFCLNLSDC